MSFWNRLLHLFHPQRSNNHRPRVLHPEALVFFSVIVIGFSVLVHNAQRITQPFGSILGYASNITTGQVLALTNAQRQSAGLAPLTSNTQLTQAAAGKAQDMFAHQYWAHTSPSGTEPWAFIANAGYRFRNAGENLARDFDTTDAMVAAWMASPTHRANIMNGQFQEIGIAVVNGVLEGTETTLVVQMFGSPASGTQAVAQIPAQASTTETEQVAQQRVPEPETTPPVEIDNTKPIATESSNQSQIVEQGETDLSSLQPEVVEQTQTNSPAVLARLFIPSGEVRPVILLSPLQILKAFFISILLLLLGVLIYDHAVMGHRRTIRLVGKNTAHIMLLALVLFLIIFFRAGSIG